jgi:hypothetical protein
VRAPDRPEAAAAEPLAQPVAVEYELGREAIPAIAGPLGRRLERGLHGRAFAVAPRSPADVTANRSL